MQYRERAEPFAALGAAAGSGLPAAGCNTAKGQNPLRRPQRIFITLTGLKGCNTAKGQNPLRLNAWQDGRLRIEVVAIPRKGRTLCG